MFAFPYVLVSSSEAVLGAGLVICFLTRNKASLPKQDRKQSITQQQSNNRRTKASTHLTNEQRTTQTKDTSKAQGNRAMRGTLSRKAKPTKTIEQRPATERSKVLQEGDHRSGFASARRALKQVAPTHEAVLGTLRRTRVVSRETKRSASGEARV